MKLSLITGPAARLIENASVASPLEQGTPLTTTLHAREVAIIADAFEVLFSLEPRRQALLAAHR